MEERPKEKLAKQFDTVFPARICRFPALKSVLRIRDEIGDMPLSLQTKLLRVLESGSFERVGDIAPLHANVRIITATNKDLEALIARGEFREDLYFRINVIPIFMPPLRERIEDNPPAHQLRGGNHSGPSPARRPTLPAPSAPPAATALREAAQKAAVPLVLNEKEQLISALRATGGNQTRAASSSRSTG